MQVNPYVIVTSIMCSKNLFTQMTRPEADVLIDNPTALPSARHAAWLIVLSVMHKRLQQPTGCIACDKIKMEAASHSVDHPGSVLTQCPPVKNVKQ